MKIEEGWLRKDFISSITSSDSIFSDFNGVIIMNTPENSFYYPARHELILYGKAKQSVKFTEIAAVLEEMRGDSATAFVPVWLNAMAPLEVLTDMRSKGGHYWCNKTDIYTQCASNGIETGFNVTETSWLIPAMQLDKDRSLIDYITAENWEVSKKNSYFNMITTLVDMLETAKQSGQTSHQILDLPLDQFETTKTTLLSLDSVRSDFPLLDTSWLNDAHLGLWELATTEEPANKSGWVQVHFPQPVEARNPEMDIRNAAVAIDFGTSSTVVAVRENGKDRLLRIGIADLSRQVVADDYQNPTIIEFIDYQSLEKAWKSFGHQPLTRWRDVHISHTAKERLSQKDTNLQGVESALQQLKQIPLKQEDGEVLCLIDQKKHEFTLTVLETSYPLSCQPASVSENIDPVELYAYYIGLAINRRPSIYLDYYLTFPVNYPAMAKQIVHASFKRGLLRSLPEQLCSSDRFARFNLRVIANEPVGYAASWFSNNGVENLEEPVHWAVFDFGGGTTDFAFGTYRPANETEEAEGYEYVFEHFGASGDLYLGGENLLENLAYLVFQHNIEICRNNRILFTKPVDASIFSGGEAFVSNSWIARTNTTLLVSTLRDVWEAHSETVINADKETIHLLDRDGNRKSIDLAVDHTILNNYLTQRLENAVQAFFVAMRSAFEDRAEMPAKVAVLLAGNASKSTLLEKIFNFFLATGQNTLPAEADNKIESDTEETDSLPEATETGAASSRPCDQFFEGWCLPVIELHAPMQGDDTTPAIPNGKTGVALGMLELLPGSRIKVIPSNDETVEAPFRYFAGVYSKRVFKPVLRQGADYGQWHEAGSVPGGAVDIVYSVDPTVLDIPARRQDTRIRQQLIEFGGETAGLKLYIRAIAPELLEVALATKKNSLEDGSDKPFSPVTIKLSMEI